MWGKNKRMRAEANKQFEIDMKSFIDTGLKRESILDVKVNKDIRHKARGLKEAAKDNDKELYIIECINVNICPVCGEDTKEVSCPRKPGCWDILIKCTKCTWQLILADLSTE